MSCKCNVIEKTLISNIAVDSGNTYVLLTPDETLSPQNEGKISFIINTSVPIAGMGLPAYMTVNGASVPVYDRFGNIVYGANLRTRFEFRSYYGTNGAGGTAHIQVINYPMGRQCNC